MKNISKAVEIKDKHEERLFCIYFPVPYDTGFLQLYSSQIELQPKVNAILVTMLSEYWFMEQIVLANKKKHSNKNNRKNKKKYFLIRKIWQILIFQIPIPVLRQTYSITMASFLFLFSK